MESHIASVERPNFLVSVLCYVTCAWQYLDLIISRTVLIVLFFSVYRTLLVAEI